MQSFARIEALEARRTKADRGPYFREYRIRSCGWNSFRYVQGEQERAVTEAEMLDALYEEAICFGERVERGEAELSNQRVSIVPPTRRRGSVAACR